MTLSFKVKSSAISSMQYDSVTSALLIKFRSGDKLYEYGPIAPHEVKNFLRAPSIGKYYHAFIKERYKKVVD